MKCKQYEDYNVCEGEPCEVFDLKHNFLGIYPIHFEDILLDDGEILRDIPYFDVKGRRYEGFECWWIQRGEADEIKKEHKKAEVKK